MQFVYNLFVIFMHYKDEDYHLLPFGSYFDNEKEYKNWMAIDRLATNVNSNLYDNVKKNGSYLNGIRRYKKQHKSKYNKKKQYNDYYKNKSLYPNGMVYDSYAERYFKPYKHPHIDNCWHCEYAKKALKHNRRMQYANNIRHKKFGI